MSSLKKLSDDELICRLNASDEKAFGEIYNRYWSKLLSQATYDLRHSAEAEECVQDVFIKLWNNRQSLSLHYKLSTYLYRAVKNQVINTLEKRYALKNTVPSIQTNKTESFAPLPDALLIEKELLAALEKAIAALPEKCAVIYKMSRVDGKTNREISAELGIAEKTVEGHITRAIKQVSGSLSGSTALSFLTFYLVFLYT